MERNESTNRVKFQGPFYVGGENMVLRGPRQMGDFMLLLVSLQSGNGNVCMVFFPISS